MALILGVWRPVEPKLLRRVHDRLSRTGGCETVWYEPSRRDANEVVADLDPVAFLAREYSAETARLRVEFDLSGDRPHHWTQGWEPDACRGFGWHADETEPDYGPAHLQIEDGGGTTDRRSADHREDEHPYRTFERRRGRISETLAELQWE